MRNRPISDNEFISLTRGIVKYTSPISGELTSFTQVMKITEDETADTLELHFVTKFTDKIKISHLQVITYNHPLLIKPVNLVLTATHKRELYRLLKAMVEFNLN